MIQAKQVLKGIKGLFLLPSLFSFLLATAQNKMTGKVIGEDNKPIIGASIKIKGTTLGAVSDRDGNFSVTAKPTDVLIISYTGYNTQEVTAGNQTSIKVTLPL